MEPISLAIGIIPLFHSCIEYFQFFKTAQSAALDIQVLLFQLDCHSEDLIIWGEKHGFFSGHQLLTGLSEEVLSRLQTAFHLLEALFKDTNALRERYGIVVSSDDRELAAEEHDKVYPSSAGLRRLGWWKTQRGNDHKDTSELSTKSPLGVLQKTRWAIGDKGKFEGLVKRIGEVIDQVEKILPVPDEFRNQTAFRDILSLAEDLQRLKLFQTASASIRPAWSNSASGLIIASEAASVRGPTTISRWIEQVEDGVDTNLDQADAMPPPPGNATKNKAKPEPAFRYIYSTLWTLWFAFLPNCPSSSLGESCDTMFRELSGSCPAFIGVDDERKKWGLGPKIKSCVGLTKPDATKIQDTLEKVSQISHDAQEKLSDLFDHLRSGLDKPAMMHIYCAPCRCAIRTAFILCRQEIVSEEIKVRVDDRILSTCCDAQNITERLQSFITTVNAKELDQNDVFPAESRISDIDFIDKEWIENRVYTLNSKLYDGEVDQDRVKNIDQFLKDIEKGERMNSLVLLEASGGAWILQTSPFRKSPLMPKELELFRYHCGAHGYSWANSLASEGKRIYRGTFTPSKLSFPQQNLQLQSKKRQRPG